MRRAVTPAIPPSMYRHFAIVTVALTMGLAMFADGENREDSTKRILEYWRVYASNLEGDNLLGSYLFTPRDIERLKGISHWVQNDAADEVNRLLIEFIRE